MSESTPGEGPRFESAEPARDPESSHGRRFPLSLIGFLHGLTLGTLLPVLPLFVHKTLDYSWQDTSVVVSGLAMGILGAPLLMSVIRRLKPGPQLGLAFSHLAAAGVVMAMAWYRHSGVGPEGAATVQVPPPLWTAIGFGLYSLALAPALRLMPEMARRTFPGPGMRGSRTWRLWGAVGFVLPAWISEDLLFQVPALRDSVVSLDVLLMFCGWAGLLTAVVAMCSPIETSGTLSVGTLSVPPEEVKTAQNSFGAGLATALVCLVMVQKCHHLWTAPYFDAVVHRNLSAEPMVHRLVVVSQVFEVLGLCALTGLVRLGGVRLLMLAGACAWVARSILLSWLETTWMLPLNAESASSTVLTAKMQLGMLLLAQVLYGFGLVGVLGALGSTLNRPAARGTGTRIALLIGIATGFGVLFGGILAETLAQGTSTAGGTTSTILTPCIQKMPESIRLGVRLPLRGWGGLWLLSATPAAVAVLLLTVARLPVRPERTRPLRNTADEP